MRDAARIEDEPKASGVSMDRYLWWSACAFALLLAGCEGGFEEFIPCSLDPKVQELGQCEFKEGEVAEDLTSQNCAIAQHPHCIVGVCLAWQGQESYCSTECKDNTDCPEGSSCQLYTSSSETGVVQYCVKDLEEEEEE